METKWLILALFIWLEIISNVLCNRKKVDKKKFKISVFYDDSYQNVKRLVSDSIDIVNEGYLNKKRFNLEFTLKKMSKHKHFSLIERLCQDLEDGRIAVMTIGNDPIFLTIYGILSVLKIPYISISWDNFEMINKLNRESFLFFPNKSEIKSNQSKELNHVNMHIPAFKIMHAILDVINKYNWDYVTVIFHESYGLERIEDLIRLPLKLNLNHKLKFQFKQLSNNMSKWEPLLEEIKMSGSHHIVVDIQNKDTAKFIEIAEEIGFLTSYFHFIFTKLDFSFLSYIPYANISVFNPVEPDNYKMNSLINEVNLKNFEKPIKISPIISYVYDAILLLAKAIHENDLLNEPSSFNISVSCEKQVPWSLGPKFMKYLKASKFDSVSGHVEFDSMTGYRKNLTLALVDRTKNGVDLIGFWKENTGENEEPVKIVRSYDKQQEIIYERLKRFLVVTTLMEEPYVMKKAVINNQKLTGNNQYMGYCIDLLEMISKKCGFNYTINLVNDGYYGSFNGVKWNGIVGELIDKKADLAIAALTITTAREEAIDFTTPFLNLGISILYKRPAKRDMKMFKFLSPLSNEVWICVIFASILVTFMMYVLARFSPYERLISYNQNESRANIHRKEWTFHNSFWFTIGPLLRQGSHQAVSVSPSVRLVSILWSFFTLILVSSYTANLAAFLTVQRMKITIQNVDDLSRQTEVKYGLVRSGSTENFFKTSSFDIYERMWKFMLNNPSVFVNSTDEGIKRVKSGGYAYLVESTTNEYVRERNCELMQIGGLLDSKGYGIATPNRSPWRSVISKTILELQEKGDLAELYKKWWKVGANKDKKCDIIEDKKTSTNKLSFESIGGIFIIVCGGMLFSFLVLMLEIAYNFQKKDSKKETEVINLKDINQSFNKVAQQKTNIKSIQSEDMRTKKRAIDLTVKSGMRSSLSHVHIKLERNFLKTNYDECDQFDTMPIKHKLKSLSLGNNNYSQSFNC